MPEAQGWLEWSGAINRHVEELQKHKRSTNQRLANIEKFLFRVRPDDEAKSAENFTLLDVIRSCAMEMVFERRIMRDAGTWQPTKLYAPGATVTFQGAAWVCQEQHEGQRPGASNNFWRLAVKSDASELRRMVREEVQRAFASTHKGAAT